MQKRLRPIGQHPGATVAGGDRRFLGQSPAGALTDHRMSHQHAIGGEAQFPMADDDAEALDGAFFQPLADDAGTSGADPFGDARAKGRMNRRAPSLQHRDERTFASSIGRQRTNWGASAWRRVGRRR